MKENRTLLALSILLVISLILNGLYVFSLLTKEDEDTSHVKPEFTYLEAVNHAEFQALLTRGEAFYVYIGRPDCGDSERFEREFIETFLERDENGEVVAYAHGLDTSNFYYFDISEIIPNYERELRTKYQEDYGFYFTPSLVFYDDVNGDGESEMVSIAEWNAVFGFSMVDYIKWFYDHGLITTNEAVYQPVAE